MRKYESCPVSCRSRGDGPQCDTLPLPRRYHLERRIFHELLELKRLQIRAGRANEQVLVKRLVDDYRRAGLSVGMQPFSGTYTFRSFEKYLYDQLRALQSDNRRVIPRLQSSDDLEKLTAALRRTRQAQHHPDNPLQCTSSTHRCHHAVHAYSGVPCAAYIPKLNHHYMPKDGLYSGFLPHIEGASARPSLSSRTAPVTLELSHGPDKQVISLPTEHLDKNKRYYVTFTIKGGPQAQQAHGAAQAGGLPAEDAAGTADVASPSTPHQGGGPGTSSAGHAKSF
ncbi:hypothetical protein FOCC_FOCC017692 [Frankliniella occidentalis]|nr:hypothetical protein FOCC_FOCC017692 [Frankliniella occidentalis]